ELERAARTRSRAQGMAGRQRAGRPGGDPGPRRERGARDRSPAEGDTTGYRPRRAAPVVAKSQRGARPSPQRDRRCIAGIGADRPRPHHARTRRSHRATGAGSQTPPRANPRIVGHDEHGVDDAPASLVARLRERHSVRQAEAAVAGVALGRWVLPSATDPDKPTNDAWFRDRIWRPLLERGGVRHVRVHDARHTYASLMLRRGVPIAYVSRQLGHSSIQVTVDLYGHFVPGQDRHHVEGLADTIEAAETQSDATQPQPIPAPEPRVRS